LKDENVTNFHPLPCVKVKSGFVSLCTVCFVDGFCAPPKRRQIVGAESKSRWGQASSTNYNSMQEKKLQTLLGDLYQKPRQRLLQKTKQQQTLKIERKKKSKSKKYKQKLKAKSSTLCSIHR